MSTASIHTRSLGLRGFVLALAIALTAIASFAPDPADAAFGDGVAIHTFEAFPSDTQAGGHPDLTLLWENDTKAHNPTGHPCGCNAAKDIVVNTPAGVIGNPHAYPRCDSLRFAFDECPIDAQIGTAMATGCLSAGACSSQTVPLFNLVPPPDQAGLLGFKTIVFNTPIFTVLTARTGGDYGLRATVPGLQNVVSVSQFIQRIWGVPADPANDGLRFGSVPLLCCGLDTGYPSNSPLRPFMTNPTTCGEESLETTLEIVAHDGGVTRASSPWPATTGCGLLDFNPSLSANPTTTEADAASGVDINLTVPQPQSPTTPSPSSIRGTTVELPEGFSVNPNAADGKTSCSDAQAKFGTEEEAQCPEHAKIGTLEVHSAVLPGVLPGGVYLGEPLPGHRYRIFLVADGFGLHIKLPGEALIDRDTGQITVAFEDLPQSPFEEFNLHIFGSERGLLATPEKCGTYPVITTFEPWNSELSDQTSTQFFQIDSGPGGSPCPGATRPFDPSFGAASQGNTAGEHTPFAVDLRRSDGDQNLDSLTVTTPPGFSGALKGIPYCPEVALTQLAMLSYSGLAEQTSSACPAASQIGQAVAGAGAGSRPLYTPGKVYLAGPYKGAPLSLVVVVPAVSGPYDLGNVATRAAIEVNPVNAQVTTVSDPFPQILEGIPLRTRSVRVNLDRENFALNPTNCDPLAVEAKITGDEGASAERSAHYQVANCAILPFAPKLALSLKGGTKRTGHPALTATLTAAPGDANLARSVVTLPKAQILDNAHIQNPCTRVQFAASACPETSRIGFAKAQSPLLDEPLQGPVYLRSSNNLLPDIVADLRGQIDVEVSARVDSVKQRVKGLAEPVNRIRTTFASVPDVPVTSFTLSMFGGNKGLLYNSENLCKEAQVANLAMGGQNGAQLNQRLRVKTPCASSSRSQKRKRTKQNRLFQARKAG